MSFENIYMLSFPFFFYFKGINSISKYKVGLTYVETIFLFFFTECIWYMQILTESHFTLIVFIVENGHESELL